MGVTRIDHLTDTERARFNEWADQWIEIGLRTGLADRAKFEASVKECYRFAGIPWPGVVVWVSSPLVLALAVPTAALVTQALKAAPHSPALDVLSGIKKRIRGAVHDTVDGAVAGAVHGAVDGAVHGAVADAVHDAVAGAVHGAVHDAVDGTVDGVVRDAVGGVVRDAVASAVHGAVAGAVHGAVDGAVHGAVASAVHGAVASAVRDAVTGAVHDTVDGAAGAVRDAVDGAVHGAVAGAVRDVVASAVRDAVARAVRGAVRDVVVGAVAGAVAGAVRDAVHDAVHGTNRDVIFRSWAYYFGGQFWVCGWYWGVALTSFFRDICHLELPGDLWDRAHAYEGTLESACWWWPHRHFVMVCERPTVIHCELVDPDRPRGFGSHRLHCGTGPAIAWPDGWGVWAIHGVRVPQQVVEAPQTLTTVQIREEPNAEIRRVMLERFGLDRYLTETDALPVHADDDGTLYQCNFSNEEPVMSVKVINSTVDPDGHHKIYVLRVDSHLRPLPPGHWPADRKRVWFARQKAQPLTARNAVASLFGLRGEAYYPAVET